MGLWWIPWPGFLFLRNRAPVGSNYEGQPLFQLPSLPDGPAGTQIPWFRGFKVVPLEIVRQFTPHVPGFKATTLMVLVVAVCTDPGGFPPLMGVSGIFQHALTPGSDFSLSPLLWEVTFQACSTFIGSG